MEVVLTREQIREVDRIAIEEYGIHGLVLMENAGRNAAHVILDEFAGLGPPSDPQAVVFCGTGNNGGDGFVIARHLVNEGVGVRLALAGEAARLSPDAAANHRICRAMGLPIGSCGSVKIGPDDVIIDALLGTGFTGSLREEMAHVIRRINAAGKRAAVAVDVPSGLDCNTGQPSEAAIVADLTITFVADKVGFHTASAADYVGRVCVVNIGAPRQIIDRVRES